MTVPGGGLPRWAGLAVAVLVAVAGCTGGMPAPPPAAPSPISSARPAGASGPTASTPKASGPTASAEQAATFVAVVDGDTVETNLGTVRLIGIDTPERGQCGHEEAAAAIRRLVSAGDQVTLVLPAGQNDRDRYDRLVRYVVTARGVDLGLVQLQAGNAIARYDSTDGYPHHPRQDAYRAAQVATPGPDGSVLTSACRTAAPAKVAPVVVTSGDDPWWRQYASCAKLKKNTVGHPKGPFRRDDPDEAAIYQWFAEGTGFRGDGDSDGLACE